MQTDTTYPIGACLQVLVLNAIDAHIACKPIKQFFSFPFVLPLIIVYSFPSPNPVFLSVLLSIHIFPYSCSLFLSFLFCSVAHSCGRSEH